VAWQRVKKPHGTTVHRAFAVASESPRSPIDDNHELGILAAMCRIMGTGGEPFYLACRTVVQLFGVGRMTAWRWLQALQFYGFIQPITTGTLKDRQASEWRFVGPEQGGNEQ